VTTIIDKFIVQPGLGTLKWTQVNHRPDYILRTLIIRSGGGHSHRLSSLSCDYCSNFCLALLSRFIIDHWYVIFSVLTVDCAVFQPLTADYTHTLLLIHRRTCSDSIPSSVYRVKMRCCSYDWSAYWSDLPGGLLSDWFLSLPPLPWPL